jgi:hypothetical protein
MWDSTAVICENVCSEEKLKEKDPWYPTSREKQARCGPPIVHPQGKN